MVFKQEQNLTSVVRSPKTDSETYKDYHTLIKQSSDFRSAVVRLVVGASVNGPVDNLVITVLACCL
jgi:hypothetical protein